MRFDKVTWYNVSMIITILILLMLVWAFFVGRSRGLALQTYYTIGSLVAIGIALQNYKALSEKITLWIPFASATANSQLSFYPAKLLFEIDHVFYAVFAFLVIYLVVYGIVRFIGIFLGALENKTLFGSYGDTVAGVLSICSAYFVLSLMMMVVSTVPVATVQNHLYASGLVRFMLNQTPLFSSWLQETFIKQITNITI